MVFFGSSEENKNVYGLRLIVISEGGEKMYKEGWEYQEERETEIGTTETES